MASRRVGREYGNGRACLSSVGGPAAALTVWDRSGGCVGGIDARCVTSAVGRGRESARSTFDSGHEASGIKPGTGSIGRGRASSVSLSPGWSSQPRFSASPMVDIGNVVHAAPAAHRMSPSDADCRFRFSMRHNIRGTCCRSRCVLLCTSGALPTCAALHRETYRPLHTEESRGLLQAERPTNVPKSR